MIVDAAIHPQMDIAEYVRRLPGPWKNHAGNVLPTPFGRLYDAQMPDAGDEPAVGRDPIRTAQVLFAEGGADAAVLVPLTRGLLPNRLHAAAVCRATNEWLCEAWLDHPQDRPWFGSIRVPVTDVSAAVAEIERWADDSRWVQIAVPSRVFAHYGEPQYLPIWEAAVAAEMPVYVQDDLSIGADLQLSVDGQPLHFAEVDAMRGLLSLVHLASLVGAGLYDRFPALRFVFGDGGIDLFNPIMWRMFNEWRQNRIEVPWVEEMPSVLAAGMARFVTQVHDHTADGDTHRPDMAVLADSASRIVYGSHTPFWDSVRHDAVLPAAEDSVRERVLSRNLLDVAPRLAAALLPVGRAE